MSLRNLIQRKKFRNWKGKSAFEIGGCTVLVVVFIAIAIHIISTILQGGSVSFSGNLFGFFFTVGMIYGAGGVVSWLIYAIYYAVHQVFIALVKAVKFLGNKKL